MPILGFRYISYDSAGVLDFGQPMAQQPACTTPLCETGPSIQVGSGIVNPNIEVSTMANGNCSATVAIANPNVAIAAMINARGTA